MSQRSKSKRRRTKRPQGHPAGKQRAARASSGRPVPETPPNLHPLQADGTLNWRDVKLAQVGAREEDGITPVQLDELPSRSSGVFLSIFCAFGLIMTAKWSLVVVALLALVILAEAKVRADDRITFRASLAAICALGTWLMVHNWDFLDADVQSLQVLALSGVFGMALWAVGDALRRAARLQQSNEHLLLGLYGMGVGCQAVCALMLTLSGVALMIGTLAPGSPALG